MHHADLQYLLQAEAKSAAGMTIPQLEARIIQYRGSSGRRGAIERLHAAGIVDGHGWSPWIAAGLGPWEGLDDDLAIEVRRLQWLDDQIRADQAEIDAIRCPHCGR